jgi:ubiquinone/menaquinone biosynthesis C-methylase UbiE
LDASYRIAAGQRILDVATGTAAARTARERAGPGGGVIAGDISGTMLDVARRNPENAGITVGQFDSHNLPLSRWPLDRVICQLGLAFCYDPGHGLAMMPVITVFEFITGGWQTSRQFDRLS